MDDLLEELGALALGSRLKRLSDLLMQDGSRIYGEAGQGFEPRWFPVFAYLYKRGPTSIMGLARGLGVSHPGINKVANELIAAKLVAPYRDRNDKRKRVLALTSVGRDKYLALEPTWRAIRQALQSAIDDGGGDFLRQLGSLERSFSDRDFASRFRSQQAKLTPVFEIRPFRPVYATAFRVLNEAWITYYFQLEDADRKTLEHPQAGIIDKGGDILFAVQPREDRVLGTCALIRVDDETAELAKMAVAAEARGQQVGLRLGEAIVDLARAKGFRTLFLESNRTLTPAISLYRKLGFTEKPFPYSSDYSRADIYMEKALPD